MNQTLTQASSTAYTHAELCELFGSALEFDRPLAPLTSYKTGGPAKYFIWAKSAVEIRDAISKARRIGLPFYMIGGGSNLLVSDQGYDGLIIKIDIRGFEVLENSVLDAGAGEELMDMVNFATNHSLAGLEFAAGIWGSVGGAIYGNAGAFGGELGPIMADAEIVTPEGEIKIVDREYCGFGYRDSRLKRTKDVIIRCRFQLQAGEKTAIEGRVGDILAQREQKHPSELTAGCFFKNIPDAREPYGKLPAGRLLEQAGAKGMAVGGARVYEKHANIIVNSGNATAKEIRLLADQMKQRVFDKFGIRLEEEVQELGVIKKD